MLQTELAVELARRFEGLSRENAKMILSTLVEVMSDVLCTGDNIKLQGIGEFYVKELPEHRHTCYWGDNAGVPFTMPPVLSLRFRPSETIKDKINGRTKK